MSRRILIIKRGALGDVIRTTPLLRVLHGEVTWVTSAAALPLLKNNPFVTKLLTIEQPDSKLEGLFDVVINLEDDAESATLASSVTAGIIVGPYLEAGRITYDTSRGEWFDMSLISCYGTTKADQLKLENRKTYQEMIFAALGMNFEQEEPILNLPLRKAPVPSLIGIEERAGAVWPAKRWTRYRDLAGRLRERNYEVKFFRQRDTIAEYADDIHECEYVICGDTLAMHLALALRKRVVTLFTCTSPWEIFGYARLAKVISPLLPCYFYSRTDSAEPANAITIAAVEDAFQSVSQGADSSLVAQIA